MTKQIKISDVLHLAADKYLAKDTFDFCNGKCKYSCDAIDLAHYELCAYNSPEMNYSIKKGLQNMGLCTSSTGEFNEFQNNGYTTPESQGARYAWLKFAAMIAEEQGV